MHEHSTTPAESHQFSIEHSGERRAIGREASPGTNYAGLRWLTERDYGPVLGPRELREMFAKALTYRPGWLVNSFELSGPAHVPPPELLDERGLADVLLPVAPAHLDALAEGTQVGSIRFAGVEHPVCIPPRTERAHTHLVGSTDKGKSTVLEHMVLQKIEAGAGVGIIDPHGSLVDRILKVYPARHLERCVYFNPCDAAWTPVWNVVDELVRQDRERAAECLLALIQSIVTGWGDRMEHILRYALHAILHRPGSTLLDVAEMLRNPKKKHHPLREEILAHVKDPIVRNFWLEDYPSYREDDTRAAGHKLSKVLLAGPVSRIFAAPESCFSIRRIMDERMVFLADLSRLGPNILTTLASLLFSLFHMSALGRNAASLGTEDTFYLYCDEAQVLETPSMDRTMAEARKFGLNLTLAHHYMSQFDRKRADALGTAGSTIIFNVNKDDAQHLAKGLMGKVEYDELVGLPPYEAIARIGSDVVRMRGLRPRKDAPVGTREAIIAQSHERYYRAGEEVEARIRQRLGCGGEATEPHQGLSIPEFPGEDFHYEVF